jgi:hypothetical protein
VRTYAATLTSLISHAGRMKNVDTTVPASNMRALVGLFELEQGNSANYETVLYAQVSSDHAVLVSHLNALDTRLSEAWLGAAFASAHRNPDRVRHVAASLREIIMHVLRYLAPDQAVLAWTQDSRDVVHGRPTRAARIRFVLERNRRDPLLVASAGVKELIAHLDTLSSYTHRLGVSLTEAELRDLFSTTKEWLTHLVQGRRGN